MAIAANSGKPATSIKRMWISYLWQIAAYRKAKALHNQNAFDIAHHVTYANGWMPSFIGALLPVPFVWGPVGGGQQTPPAFYGEYTRKAITEDGVRFLAQLALRFDPFVILCKKRARAILACNQETKDRFYAKHANKVQFFPVNGLSAADARLLSQKKKNKKFTVLLAGRMISLKGDTPRPRRRPADAEVLTIASASGRT